MKIMSDMNCRLNELFEPAFQGTVPRKIKSQSIQLTVTATHGNLL
jgi:hypothetical protein